MDETIIKVILEPYKKLIEQLENERDYLRGLINTFGYQNTQLTNLFIPKEGSGQDMADPELPDTALTGGELNGNYPEPTGD